METNDKTSGSYYAPKQFIEITTIKMDIHGTKVGDILNLSENVEHTSQYKEAVLRYNSKTGNLVETLSVGLCKTKKCNY